MVRRLSVLAVVACGLGLSLTSPLTGCAQQNDLDSTAVPVSSRVDSVAAKKDVPYVATPQPVVERMLAMADVSPKDVVYDLGSGDGRFVITAAQQFGARAVGVEIDPELVRDARANARLAGVTDRVEFRQGDLFDTDLREATVVMLYLEPALNMRLRPTLLLQLDPGDRVVSHNFDMGPWTPDRVEKMENSTVYLWTVPDRIPDSLAK